MYAYMYKHTKYVTCTHAYTRARDHACDIYTYEWTHANTHIHTHTYIYIYIYIYIYYTTYIFCILVLGDEKKQIMDEIVDETNAAFYDDDYDDDQFVNEHNETIEPNIEVITNKSKYMDIIS